MLPTCPACKQSVLDDDATECPFCGANMKTGKGGGSGKPAAAKPVAPASKSSATPPPASKSATSKPASKPAPASRKSMLDDDDDDPFSSGEDDDPFAAATKQDAASKAKAIAVSPRKTKTHIEELKCPMCDTVGFVPENVSGKDVKCSNPKCPVPVFMAPKKFGAPAPIAAPPPKPKREGPSKKPLIFAIIGGVAFVAVVGLAVLFWPEPAGPKDNPLPPLPNGTTIAGVPGVGEKPDDRKQQDTAVVQAAAPALDVANVFALMEHHSLEEVLVNKKFCRLRTATAYAVVHDVEKMREQFKALEQVDHTLPHFKIPALLALGWQQLATGDKAAAKTADEALQATAAIGKGSRDTQEAVMDLAAFLVATGKVADAHKLLAEHFVQDASTPFVVNLAYARHRRDFDFDQETPGQTANPKCDWGDVGVTLILASEGLWNEAQQWAEGNPDIEARTDCVLAWADARLHEALAKQQTPDPTIEGAGDKLSPGGKVQLLARLALTQAIAGKSTDAERLVAAAVAGLKAIPVPPAARYEGFKAALEWKAPDAVALRQAVLAAAAISTAQARLQKMEDAWTNVVAALQYARAMAPSPASVASMRSEADAFGPQNLREKLRAELKLNSQDEATRKARDLKNKLDSTEQLGLARFRLQEAVFRAAVTAGLGSQVWDEARSWSQNSDPNELEPYLSGTLPAYLIQQFNTDGLPAKAAEVTAKIEGTEPSTDEVLELQHQIAESLQNQKLNEVVEIFGQRRLTGGTEALALKTFAHAAKQPGQALATLAAVTAMETKSNNQFVKYEALRMLAAYASRQGNPDAVRDAIKNQKQSPIERVSAYLGLLEGYTAWQRAQPPPKTEADKPKAAQASK